MSSQGRPARGHLAVTGLFCLLTLTATASSCLPGEAQGTGGDVVSSEFAPDRSMPAPAHRGDLPCGDAETDHLCIAIKYTSYKDPQGRSTMSRTQAQAALNSVNQVWEQCHIEFSLETYEAVDPTTRGLAFSPTALKDLGSVRSAVSDTTGALLVTATGPWSGDLGAQAANAWTVLPPVGPFGVVVEGVYASVANLLAHELGHYLNLDHVSDAFDVMNPTVYSNSLNLTDSQCAEARATAISFWSKALR